MRFLLHYDRQKIALAWHCCASIPCADPALELWDEAWYLAPSALEPIASSEACPILFCCSCQRHLVFLFWGLDCFKLRRANAIFSGTGYRIIVDAHLPGRKLIPQARKPKLYDHLREFLEVQSKPPGKLAQIVMIEPASCIR